MVTSYQSFDRKREVGHEIHMRALITDQEPNPVQNYGFFMCKHFMNVYNPLDTVAFLEPYNQNTIQNKSSQTK